jgi:hypothetical protein
VIQTTCHHRKKLEDWWHMQIPKGRYISWAVMQIPKVRSETALISTQEEKAY